MPQTATEVLNEVARNIGASIGRGALMARVVLDHVHSLVRQYGSDLSLEKVDLSLRDLSQEAWKARHDLHDKAGEEERSALLARRRRQEIKCAAALGLEVIDAVRKKGFASSIAPGQFGRLEQGAEDLNELITGDLAENNQMVAVAKLDGALKSVLAVMQNDLIESGACACVARACASLDTRAYIPIAIGQAACERLALEDLEHAALWMRFAAKLAADAVEGE